MVGRGTVTVKLEVLTAVPLGVTILIKPVVLPAVTMPIAVVWPTLKKLVVLVLFMDAEVAPVKLIPVIATVVPTGPEVGAKLVMIG
jgi:hypothetical protein